MAAVPHPGTGEGRQRKLSPGQSMPPVMVEHHVRFHSILRLHLPYHRVLRGVATTREFTMSIAMANGEGWSTPRQDSEFINSIESEFRRRFPRRRKWLLIYEIRTLRNWSFKDIGEGVDLNRGHCCKAFNETRAAIEELIAENLACVAPRLRVYRG